MTNKTENKAKRSQMSREEIISSLEGRRDELANQAAFYESKIGTPAEREVHYWLLAGAQWAKSEIMGKLNLYNAGIL